MDVLNLIIERQSSRMPFDPNQPVSKEDLQLNSRGSALDPNRAQYAKFRNRRCR